MGAKPCLVGLAAEIKKKNCQIVIKIAVKQINNSLVQSSLPNDLGRRRQLYAAHSLPTANLVG